MCNKKNIDKKVIYAATGNDQLGNAIGVPQPGDVVKVHMTAAYVAKEALFLKFGVKSRTKEFLSTHIVGDTAFYEFPISKEHSGKPSSATDILTPFVESMALGEQAVFTLGMETMDEHTKSFFATKLHKGHYKNVPANATKLIFTIDSFKVVRKNKVHSRPNRNGTGARMPGSFSGGAM